MGVQEEGMGVEEEFVGTNHIFVECEASAVIWMVRLH